MNKLPIIFFSILVMSSCAGKMDSSPDATLEQQDQATALLDMPKSDLYSNGAAKLIRSVQYRFQVTSVKTSTEAIENLVRKYPAYISASGLRLENPILENKITIRVQSEFFEPLLKEIDQQAIFVNLRDVTTEDVSKNFVELESRLKTKREVEQRYSEILRSKAGTINELLDAEKQINSLHEEIEATVSKLNYLKEQVSYSTINLEYYQTINEEVYSKATIGLGTRFGEALRTGWNGVVDVLVLFAYVWPLLVVSILGLVFLRWRRYRSA